MLATYLSLATASAIALASTVSAVPLLECKTVLTDDLTLVKDGKTVNVSFIADYRQNDAIKQYGESVPKGDTSNPRVLTAFNKTKASKFKFQACTSTATKKSGSFVKAPAKEHDEGLTVYNGHLVSVSSGKCVALDQVYSDLSFLSETECSGADDSSQARQYWRAVQNKKGSDSYTLYYTYSHDYSAPHGELKFAPGKSSNEQALLAKDGTISGGAWALTL